MARTVRIPVTLYVTLREIDGGPPVPESDEEFIRVFREAYFQYSNAGTILEGKELAESEGFSWFAGVEAVFDKDKDED